jgi:hypothetical protein
MAITDEASPSTSKPGMRRKKPMMWLGNLARGDVDATIAGVTTEF